MADPDPDSDTRYVILGVPLLGGSVKGDIFEGVDFPFKFKLEAAAGRLILWIFLCGEGVAAKRVFFNDLHGVGKHQAKRQSEPLHATEKEALEALDSFAEMTALDTLASLDKWNAWALNRAKEILQENNKA